MYQLTGVADRDKVYGIPVLSAILVVPGILIMRSLEKSALPYWSDVYARIPNLLLVDHLLFWNTLYLLPVTSTIILTTLAPHSN
jgi:hypothetical protein